MSLSTRLHWRLHGHSHQYNIPNPSCDYSIPHNGNPNITKDFGNLGQCQQNGRCYFINFPWLGTKITSYISWFCVSTSRRTIFLKSKEIGYIILQLVTLDCNFTRHQWFQRLIFDKEKNDHTFASINSHLSSCIKHMNTFLAVSIWTTENGKEEA